MDPYSAKDCSTCSHNAFCSGGSDISLNLGFWRISNGSDFILDCDQFAAFCL